MPQLTSFNALLSISLVLVVASSLSASDDRKTYIIHMDMDKSSMPSIFSNSHEWYMSTLLSLSSPDGVPPVHLYSYKHVMNGFSAVLSQAHLEQLEELPSHVATFEEMIGHAHTTRTPRFLGLSRHTGLWPASKFGSDVIIGVLDTGIWPESESFSDKNMPPVPQRWRGACETGTEFNTSHCNRKLIGARKFSQGMKHSRINISNIYDYDSPRDFLGHGSHTSSIAAGSPVRDADYFGYAKGTATGMAPKARIAMYKVLFYSGANDDYDAAATDVLAGMDQAIEDGVDIMSLSLSFFETPFYKNPIAIGAFAALRKGIFVACSAGNNGPHGYTMFNGAPWITTVGAGTVDRQLGAEVTVGDGLFTVTGTSMYPENLFVFRVPLYFGQGNRSKELCDYNSLVHKEVEGKFVFCDHDNESTVKSFSDFRPASDYGPDIAGAIGAIYSSDDGEFQRPEDFSLPFVTVSTKDGDRIKKYILNSKNATVSVKFGVTKLGTKPAPKVAWFSSRGPDERSPWILKPDILAPGYNVLAAWVPNRGFAPIHGDDYLLTDYAILSGTSMSCPHVAGVAALLKATHPDWSPAAIRSAIMTTANILDNTNKIIVDMTTEVSGTPLDFGAGHLNPNKAMDPGLLYDMEAEDYFNYLCKLRYTKQQIQIITGTPNVNCDHATFDLNYPSFALVLNNTNSTASTFKRVLTNAADNGATYQAVVQAPSGMKVAVEPLSLYFAGKNSKAEFTMTVEINVGVDGITPHSDYIGNFGFLSWYEVNGTHVVRSPIVSAFASPRT